MSGDITFVGQNVRRDKMSGGTKHPERKHHFGLFSINSTYIGFLLNSMYIDYSPSTVHLYNVIERILTVLINIHFLYTVFSIQDIVYSDVCQTKHPWGQNVQRDKTSGETKRPETKHPFGLFSINSTYIQ
jgi:hypothetical protein